MKIFATMALTAIILTVWYISKDAKESRDRKNLNQKDDPEMWI